jgi:hypothetical protein
MGGTVGLAPTGDLRLWGAPGNQEIRGSAATRSPLGSHPNFGGLG